MRRRLCAVHRSQGHRAQETPGHCERDYLSKVGASQRSSDRSRLDRDLGELRRLREIRVQVDVALPRDPALVGLLPVAAVELLDHGHPVAQHLPERGEALAVQERVVAVVDEELRRARVRARRGVDEGPALVAPQHGVVPDVRELGLRLRWQPELRDEAGHDAEDGGVVEPALLHELLELRGAQRRPLRVDPHGEAGVLLEVPLQRDVEPGVEGRHSLVGPDLLNLQARGGQGQQREARLRKHGARGSSWRPSAGSMSRTL
mmetsp:Transcript_90509/g.235696  ORF Transcript_90509/g.235696 Transcript_90509/m.235696 type:complete len:261 (-) Transcript_90509:12-794(-)